MLCVPDPLMFHFLFVFLRDTFFWFLFPEPEMVRSTQESVSVLLAELHHRQVCMSMNHFSVPHAEMQMDSKA